MKILVVLEYSMLYIKFQGHRPLGSKEEDFRSFSSYMGIVMRTVSSIRNVGARAAGYSIRLHSTIKFP